MQYFLHFEGFLTDQVDLKLSSADHQMPSKIYGNTVYAHIQNQIHM